ncbi:CsiV family protein [Methylohalobius crimeensis]|uniref:CsiV family protein n=1 Tax=Methylohalobius crimeensis TaxID=244365 RepID=UPI0009FD2DD5|nr:CsiV family protein [Methylohalobius crimeensis]
MLPRISVKLSLVFLLFVIPLLPASAASTPGWYQMAVVVFAQPVDTDEDLSDQPSFPWPEDMRQPSPLVADAQSGLYSAYDRLRRSRDYRPLLHTAWVQPAYPQRINAPYHIGAFDSSVEGVVRLQRGEYLRVLVDMEYRAPDGTVHRLSEKRRVKFNETHYLDHPAFGVLIRVSPAKAPEIQSQ